MLDFVDSVISFKIQTFTDRQSIAEFLWQLEQAVFFPHPLHLSEVEFTCSLDWGSSSQFFRPEQELGGNNIKWASWGHPHADATTLNRIYLLVGDYVPSKALKNNFWAASFQTFAPINMYLKNVVK